MTIGILGEDETDCRTVRVLVRRILDAPAGKGVPVKLKYPPTGGCSTLRRKAAAYMADLARNGCRFIILVHDLDRNGATGELNHEPSLRLKLEAISLSPGVERHICIPVEELEAWFWSSQAVLDDIAVGKARAHAAPHTIWSPKEKLEKLSRRGHHKAVYSTNENERLAGILELADCRDRCDSFRALEAFVRGIS